MLDFDFVWITPPLYTKDATWNRLILWSPVSFSIVVPITKSLMDISVIKRYKISTLWRNSFSGFPAAAAYAAAYAGRGYSSYPGLLAGYPTGRNWDAPSCMNHPFTWCWYIEMRMTIRLNCWWCHCCMPHTSIIEPAQAGLNMQNMQNMQKIQKCLLTYVSSHQLWLGCTSTMGSSLTFSTTPSEINSHPSDMGSLPFEIIVH